MTKKRAPKTVKPRRVKMPVLEATKPKVCESATISEQDYAELFDSIDTAVLLSAVDHVDKIRDVFDGGLCRGEPEFRTKLLQLHQIGMSFINEGARSKAQAFFDLNGELNDILFDARESLDALSQILDSISDKYPDSLT